MTFDLKMRGFDDLKIGERKIDEIRMIKETIFNSLKNEKLI